MGTVKLQFEKYGKLNLVNIYFAKGERVKHKVKILPVHANVYEYAVWLCQLYECVGFNIAPIEGVDACLIS